MNDHPNVVISKPKSRSKSKFKSLSKTISKPKSRSKSITPLIVKENLSPHMECEWKIYRDTIPKENYHLISVSYFSKKDKSDEAKKKYFEGLKQLYFMMRKILPHYILRVYCDTSVIERVLSFYHHIKSDHMEIFQYHIPLLFEINANVHKGTTGTLWRFLPLHDLKLHTSHRTLVLDVDTHYNDLFLKLIRKIEDEKRETHFMYRSHAYYYLTPRLSCVESDIQFEYLVAHFIYQTNKVSSHILSDFLERYFVNLSNHNKSKIYQTCEMKSEFEYGIDEIFMNEYFLPKQFKQTDKVDILYHLSHYDYRVFITEALNMFYKNMSKSKNKSKNEDKIHAFLKKIFESLEFMNRLKEYHLISTNGKIKIYELLESIKKNNTFYDFFIDQIKNKHILQKLIYMIKEDDIFSNISQNQQNLLLSKYIIGLYKIDHFFILTHKREDGSILDLNKSTFEKNVEYINIRQLQRMKK